MSEDTKRKLSKYVKDPFVRDVLEAFGIVYPRQIQELDDDELKRAGLQDDEISALRKVKKLKKDKAK